MTMSSLQTVMVIAMHTHISWPRPASGLDRTMKGSNTCELRYIIDHAPRYVVLLRAPFIFSHVFSCPSDFTDLPIDIYPSRAHSCSASSSIHVSTRAFQFQGLYLLMLIRHVPTGLKGVQWVTLSILIRWTCFQYHISKLGEPLTGMSACVGMG